LRKLFLIPARGGSKGLPGKNILNFKGKPLICHTIDAAKEAMGEDDILCVSTEDARIRSIVEAYGIKIHFDRPMKFATDKATTLDVISHAVDWFKLVNESFDLIVLLQATSPLRKARHIIEALDMWSSEVDMIVSVKKTDSNPYYSLFEEDSTGLLVKTKQGDFNRRQDCPVIYEYNGAIYIFSTGSSPSQALRKRKYVMSKMSSIDIDDAIDFKLAEYFFDYNR
jgi:CMP-N,N'-diacetyllegionaminic acid synthase